MKTQNLFICIVLTAFLFASCDKSDDQDGGGTTLKSQQVVTSSNQFGLDIFQQIYANEDSVNFMISPLSISIALSMAYNGADSETKTEMAEALRIDDFTVDEINTIYYELIDALVGADSKVTMEIANSIWYSDEYSVEQDFLDVNVTYYDAEVNEADFSDVATVDSINQWVSDKTHEKITNIISDISPSMVMILANAIYFNGTWTQEFNPESTQEMFFETSDGDNVDVDMMGREDTLDYLSNDTFSAIKLPYGSGNFSMMVMLPNNNKSVDDVVDLLTPENWEDWQEEFAETKNVEILLPKFKVEYEKQLNEILEDMGMELAFTPYADFSGINPLKDLYISYVKHKTFIEVDEEGTEAAAVTVIGWVVTSIGDEDESDKICFYCDRPFLFAITEKDTGAILFMGKIGNPALDTSN